MRLWSFHPKYLDSKGLVALWREALLAQAVLRGRTKAYARHPQLIRFRQTPTPGGSIAAYLEIVHAEGCRRGFKFDIGRIARSGCVEGMTVTRGQLHYEWDHFMTKLLKRDPRRAIDLRSVRKIDPHPLLTVVQGGVEDWEKR
ncbi:MAG: pyrimidine dimer DNA glycosylase/endonuclease V [Deltaproteobacteria bacterium]|nr:pyrimidine dimer DNA glycosylase/endonuclease V [Deltaproteobacteria bacterium]